MKSKEYIIKKIANLDTIETQLRKDIVNNRYERELWQNQLDSIDKSSGFPIHGTREARIKYIFNNVFQRAIRMSELEDKNEEFIGKYEKLSNVMRRMKDEGTVVSIRYNKQNTLTFWGLSLWVGVEDFKEEYKPLKTNFKNIIAIKEKL